MLEALSGVDAPLSVDTRRARVMREALAAGASMINDIDALSAPGALEAVAQSDCAVCLMHKKGEPASMQREPHYDDVVREVKDYLAGRIAAAERAGIGRARIVADVGFGFGKTLRHNLELQRRLGEFAALGVPLAGRLVAQVEPRADYRPRAGRAPGGERRGRIARRAGWGENTAGSRRGAYP